MWVRGHRCSARLGVGLLASLFVATTGGTIAEAESKAVTAAVEEQRVATEHEVAIGGRDIEYTATAGTVVLRDREKDKPEASIFYVAYTKDGVDDSGERPIMFSFNGGPGSSSIWLHMGALGPYRVNLDAFGKAATPPAAFVPNAESLLDRTDLVFIDPVSTGYSRAAPNTKAGKFHGVRSDVKSVGEFIRLYVTRNDRWLSPKFVIGESYGATRAGFLSRHLRKRYGMELNGVALISAALDFQTISFHEGNDLPYTLFLPTYTATAWYHDALGDRLQKQDLRAVLERAERFAEGPYARALREGSELSEARRREIAGEFSRLTGLSTTYVTRGDLRVPIQRFAKELLRDRGRTVGRFDSRYTGRDPDLNRGRFAYDPSYEAIQGAFTSALYGYMHRELDYTSDLPYKVISRDVHPWDYGPYKNRYVNAANALRKAMTRNPHLKVFVAAGYYDLATPYRTADHTLRHMDLPPEVRRNLTGAIYEAGHMMYVHKPSRVKLKHDLAAFIADATGE